MKRLSYWASQHVWQSWLIIILLYNFLGWTATFLGTYLYLEGILFGKAYIYSFAVLFSTAVLVYPNIKKRGIYWQRKTNDFSLVMLSFIGYMLVFNQFTHKTIQHPPSNEYAYPMVNTSKKTAKWTKKLERKMKRIHQKTIKVVERFQHRGNAGIIALAIILSIILAFVSLLLLTILSCNLSCGASMGVISLLLLGTITSFTLTILTGLWASREIKALRKIKATKN